MYFRILFIHLIPFLHSNVEIEAKLLSPISENRACLVSDKFLLERDRKKHNYRTFSKYTQIKGKVFKIFSEEIIGQKKNRYRVTRSLVGAYPERGQHAFFHNDAIFYGHMDRKTP